MTPPSPRAIAVRMAMHTTVSIIALGVAITAVVLGVYEIGHLALAPRWFGASTLDGGTLVVVLPLTALGSTVAVLLARRHRLPRRHLVRASLEARTDGHWAAVDYPSQDAPVDANPAEIAGKLVERWADDPAWRDSAVDPIRVRLLYADDTAITIDAVDLPQARIARYLM